MLPIPRLQPACPVHHWFTLGFDSTGLKDAKALLEQIAWAAVRELQESELVAKASLRESILRPNSPKIVLQHYRG